MTVIFWSFGKLVSATPMTFCYGEVFLEGPKDQFGSSPNKHFTAESAEKTFRLLGDSTTADIVEKLFAESTLKTDRNSLT